MTWRMRQVSVLLRGKTVGGADAVNRSAIVATILSAACLGLLLTAPVNGDFWWADAPRHALNGAFVRDFIGAHPIHQPVQWAIDYYLRRPALTIMFYPPLFYVAEAITFTLFGVSHFVAQFTVSLFTLLLGVSAYILARTFLPRWSALGAALLVVGTPETAFWGRQIMLDVPAYALIAASAACLAAYVTKSRPVAIYSAALFVLAAIYTKYNAGFIAPALAAAFVVAKGRATLRDRHVLIAGALTVIGLLPAIAILLRFGAQNLTSMSGLQGTLPLNSLACWLFYLQTLPAQIGWLTTLLAAGGFVLIVKRIGGGQDRWAYALLLAWLAVGYLFFTLISLKEPRDTVMVLLPLAIAAPLFLLTVLPKKLGEPAGLALGLGTLLYTLVFCPVPRVAGYQDIASYLAKNVPRDGLVLYSGYRDGNLIFDLATIGERSDITIVRVDKLLLSAPVGERRRGIKQADYDEATIERMLRDLGASYFVVQPGFWSDLAVMGRFDNVVNSPDYVKAAHFGLSGDLSTQDGAQGIDILQPTYPVAPKSGRISIDMPLAGQRFEGTTHP
jgi:hypothetical protein